MIKGLCSHDDTAICSLCFDDTPLDLPMENSMTEHDPVNHPTHYASDAKCSGCGEPIECIDVVRHMGFDQGNAMKYLWRAGKKDALVQDLKKAVWYIEDMIAEAEGRQNPNVHRLSSGDNFVLNNIMTLDGARSFVEDTPRKCEYVFENDEYRCSTHGMQKSKHHPREGAHRLCLWMDPGETEEV